MALILITLLIVPHYQQMCVLYLDITKNFSAQNYVFRVYSYAYSIAV